MGRGRTTCATRPLHTVSMADLTDDEVLGRQHALQAEAAEVLADLDLLDTLGTVGTPVQVGSSALGLMVARDIDITTLCPALEAEPIFDLVRPLARHPRVRRLAFRNDTGRWNVDPRYPDGLYWMVEYVTAAGIEWNLDLWFLREGTTQFDLEDLRSMPPRLTPEARLAILRIKEARQGLERDRRSFRIYEAVLDHGVRTPDEFVRYVERS
jgi:hypothetical protein